MTADNMVNSLPLGDFPMEEGEKTDWIWGQLHLQAWVSAGQLWLRHRLLDEEGQQSVMPDRDWEENRNAADWIRWPLKGAVKSIGVNAITPDLPFVIKSKHPIYMHPGQSIDVMVSVPCWAKLTVRTADKEWELGEYSTIFLQKTWFGTPLDGELCYWRQTQAVTGEVSKDARPNYIICPVRITNKSDEVLNFEQFNFRVEELTLFRHEDRLWADETRIDFKGQTQTSDVTNTGRLPRHLGIRKPELVCSPRKQTRKSITRRTFNFLLNI